MYLSLLFLEILFYCFFLLQGASLLARYGGSLEMMIKDAFPELHFKDEGIH